MKVYKAISWGCGVQSTTMAVMSALGDLEHVDVVITADTGWERKKTYGARDFYTRWLQEHGISVEIIYTGDIKEKGIQKNSTHFPFYTSSGAPLRRQCTRHFKIDPIKRRLRQLYGFHPSKPPHPKPNSIDVWLGISTDEFTRMNQSRVKFIRNCYPLIEQRISRNDCVDYLQSHNLPVPVKSACVGCPYHLASEWLAIKTDSPEEFDDAINFDRKIRELRWLKRNGVEDDRVYIYKHKQPLEDADLEADAQRERKGKQLPLMICESGYCMV